MQKATDTFYSTDLVHHVAEELDLTNKAAKRAVQSTLRGISSLPEDSALSIRGFGKFRRYLKKERKAHNPATGGSVTVPPKEVIRFNPSPNIFDY